MTVRFIADLHYTHDNILRFDKRPYENVEDHDKDLIRKWNEVVRNPNDETYILGDIFWGKPEQALPLLKQLRGKKYLIEGNHDRFVNDKSVYAAEMRSHFEEITKYKVINLDKKKVIMCHYPIPQFDGHFGDKAVHLYGHVHQTFEYKLMKKFIEEGRLPENGSAKTLMFNVGAMMPYMDYAPRTLEYILEHGE